MAVLGFGGYQWWQYSRISDLLGRAESRLAAGQLTAPALDNADFYFRQALRLDADNAEALDGLRRVLDARIAEALELAAQRLASDQLLEPAEDSAVHYYQRVLGWLPDNQPALDGLTRVSERYVELAEAAYDRREYALALEYIQQGLEAAPQYAPLLALHDGHARRVASPRTASGSAHRSQRATHHASHHPDVPGAGQPGQAPVESDLHPINTGDCPVRARSPLCSGLFRHAQDSFR
nr:hypothetical protein [Stutzerimonas stutzeri]